MVSLQVTKNMECDFTFITFVQTRRILMTSIITLGTGGKMTVISTGTLHKTEASYVPPKSSMPSLSGGKQHKEPGRISST